MSSSNHNEYFRFWMDHNHQDPSTGLVTEEFAEGLQQFMSFALNQQRTLETGKMYCACPVCQNRRFGTNVPIKKGRRYGIGRTSEAISSSSSQLSVSSSSIVQYMERMKTELDEERTKRQAIEEQLRSVTTFISNLYPEQFSATQTQPDSATQSPDDQCF
ncbi:hypothetical protein F2Q70_00020547 [Brassica cretica]|uniref:Transposase-associated domain-containing protein n=1 Tax=Brassica cretica TaxID=69181 RepID=A0A8S9GLQ6_BRACR|nr:hypothetical protein F2Q70_00020547 [Brassica cretica]